MKNQRSLKRALLSSFSFPSCSFALDSSDRPHIAYGGDHLYYAYFDGTQWQYEVVDSA
jgi:hypothetical protein